MLIFCLAQTLHKACPQYSISLLLTVSRNNSRHQSNHETARKHKQLYRHADPRQQWLQAVQQRVTEYQLQSLAAVRLDGFHSHVTLSFGLLTPGSMYAERLLQSILYQVWR